jgi:hypothetical protein
LPGGVIGWLASYPSRLERSCTTVIALGDRSCRTVKGILAAGTKREALEAHAQVTAQDDVR